MLLFKSLPHQLKKKLTWDGPIFILRLFDTLPFVSLNLCCSVFNRPGVPRAVLQRPLLLIMWVIISVIIFLKNLWNSFKRLELFNSNIDNIWLFFRKCRIFFYSYRNEKWANRNGRMLPSGCVSTWRVYYQKGPRCLVLTLLPFFSLTHWFFEALIFFTLRLFVT